MLKYIIFLDKSQSKRQEYRKSR